jgi:hypothetical protein
MKPQTTTNLLLAAIALLLLALVLRPVYAPAPVHAQAPNADLYLEPGTYLLRAPDNSQQVYGKVAVDLTNGKVWGLPTNNTAPFPMDPVNNKPMTTRPFLLGRFALEDMRR